MVRGLTKNFCPRFMYSLIISVLFLSLSACAGVHFHNAGNEAKANKILEDYNKVELTSLIQIGRDLSTKLIQDELQIRQELIDTLVKADLRQVIGSNPEDIDPTTGGKLGWNKLEKEIGDAFSGIDDKKIIREIPHYMDYIRQSKERYEKSVSLYKSEPDPGTQEIDCSKIDIKRVENTSEPPLGESREKWSDYQQLVIPNCKDLREAENTGKEIRQLLLRIFDKERKDNIEHLKKEISASEEKENELRKKYDEAKEKVAKAEKELAESSEEKKIEEAKVKVDQLIGIFKDIEKIINDTKKLPFLEAEFKADLLETLLSLSGYITGGAESPVAKNISGFIQEDLPQIVGSFNAAQKPQVDALQLALAVERLKYRRLTTINLAKKRLLSLDEAELGLYAEELSAWSNLDTAVNEMTNKSKHTLRMTSLDEYFKSADLKTRENIVLALYYYTLADIYKQKRENISGVERRQAYRSLSLDMSEISLEAWDSLIRAPLNVLASYHEGGIRSEDIANLLRAIQAAGIITIGVRVD
ncbi:MAG: hypothetical protein WBD99_01975 [Thermodesulfobacteriota bacterium]